ncbi:flavodoxin family protein [Candidatus Bathyarchaeota archaeon]|nr:flavodoxin family protein [Candidatus Bathyarchaeota archaeon]MBS7630976.1 flavodoxin family protein [Candidatus Bathyarchaeota archaeon]
MKILGIVGSPRLGGNTETLTRIALEEVSKEGIETELISLAGKKITPCDACGSCRTTGVCHIQDDFQEVYGKMVESDGFILATPVWFGGATPQMVSLISRCYLSRGGKNPFENKVGGPIVVARRAGKNFTFAQLMFFYMIHGMIVPGSTYWNVAIGREKGEVMNDEEGVRTIRNFGRKLAWLAKKLNT